MINILIIFSAEYLVWVIALISLSFAIYSNAYRRKELYILSGLIFGIAFVIDKILNKIISSPRPFVTEKINPLVFHLANNGFPSEHTLFAVLVSGIIFLYNKKVGAVLGILSIMIGMGRVLARVHNPIDIIGSFSIGVFSIYVGCIVYKKLFNKLTKT